MSADMVMLIAGGGASAFLFGLAKVADAIGKNGRGYAAIINALRKRHE